MTPTILIIHGWNDSSKSFENLKEGLIQSNYLDIEEVFFVDYNSKEDSLTLPMLADGLNDRLKEKTLIKENGTSEKDMYVIVHSTGALVIRQWLVNYYKENFEQCPIKKIVMLAPANFGSPWAHKGKSILGRIFKGQNDEDNYGEVGKLILDGLELASPYQWKLSHQDLLSSQTMFTADKIQTTILVGLEDNIDGFFNKIANKLTLKEGTDNTVVIAGTALNTIKISIDYTKKNDNTIVKVQDSFTETAFVLLQKINHLNICERIIKPSHYAYQTFIKALTIENSEGFKSYILDLAEQNKKYYTTKSYKPYQLFIVHIVDADGEAIDDFYIDFSIFKASSIFDHKQSFISNANISEVDSFSRKINKELTRDFHRNTTDGSYRSFLVDINAVNNIIQKAKQKYPEGIVLTMQIHIASDISEERSIVLYNSNSEGEEKLLTGKSFIYPNTTTLIEVKVDRKIAKKYVNVESST